VFSRDGRPGKESPRRIAQRSVGAPEAALFRRLAPHLESAPVPADDSAPDLTQRVARVLALAEAWLAPRVAAAPDLEAFARHLAFRWESGREGRAGRLVAIPDPALHDLDDLLGVERALERLVRNTEQFVAGLPSNHVLLYGERGTGKSSAVRGLLQKFAARGLRIVEVHKSDLLHLPDVLAALRGAPCRFLLFCDDLSFDEGESGYRELKAALEGSLEAPPENVRIVATSNRRHLLPEKRSENQQVRVDEDGELRLGEAIDEKLALSDRFGLVLGFFGFDQATYLRIVAHLARKAGVELDEATRVDALRWALDRSSRSGRTARQFVADLAGRRALETLR
jgi:predicted AAA+ superfamily ATPase